jgi:hypothetical protein
MSYPWFHAPIFSSFQSSKRTAHPKQRKTGKGCGIENSNGLLAEKKQQSV